MRQAGILAAAGIVSLDKMTSRLVEDHRRAKKLAEGLSQIPCIRFELGLPQTNMVFPSVTGDSPITARKLASELTERGIRVGVVGECMLRLVTHNWITDENIEQTLNAFRQLLIG